LNPRLSRGKAGARGTSVVTLAPTGVGTGAGRGRAAEADLVVGVADTPDDAVRDQPDQTGEALTEQATTAAQQAAQQVAECPQDPLAGLGQQLLLPGDPQHEVEDDQNHDQGPEVILQNLAHGNLLFGLVSFRNTI